MTTQLEDARPATGHDEFADLSQILRGPGTLPCPLATTPLAPFGLLVEGRPGARLDELSPELLSALTDRARVVVVRGFELLDKEALIQYATRLGPPLLWNFGAVLDLTVQEEAKNYLFTRGDVPFHWDGAFAAAEPRYFMFQCLRANDGRGGETVFSDTTRVWADATPGERALWQGADRNSITTLVARSPCGFARSGIKARAPGRRRGLP